MNLPTLKQRQKLHVAVFGKVVFGYDLWTGSNRDHPLYVLQQLRKLTFIRGYKRMSKQLLKEREKQLNGN